MGKFKNANFDAYAAAVRQRESSGDYAKVNKDGYTGAYQFGRLALIDAGLMDQNGNWTDYARSLGVNSMKDFKNKQEAQDTAFQNLTEKNWDYLRDYLPYVGRTIGGIPITVSGLLAGAHLVGNGAVKQFLDSDGTTIIRDGNGTPVTEYMKKFGGYDFKFDNNRKGFGGVFEPPPTAVPYLAQTQSLEPAFAATEWLQRPASPNVLAPEAVPPLAPLAGAPRVAATPYVEGTRKARQALDNSLPAPGAAAWSLSDRFGRWNSLGGVSGPVTSDANGAGPGRTGNSNGPESDDPRFAQSGSRSASSPPPSGGMLAAASPNLDPSSVRRLSSPVLGITARDPNQPSRGAATSDGIDSVPLPDWSPDRNGLSLDDIAAAPGHSPTPSQLDALLAQDRKDLVLPLPYRSPSTPDASGGIPGMTAQDGLFDPSAGGLLRLLQDYMRSNPTSV